MLFVLNESFKNKIDLLEVKKAIYYARKYHGSQMQQSGKPYYSHPIEVDMFARYMAIKIPQYFKTDLIVTALLHDCLEDTILTQQMIANIFNQQIANQVEDLTRIKSYGKISSIELVNILLKQKKYSVLFIKQFDRLHNMQTLFAKSPEKANKIIEETIAIFLALAAHFNMLDLEQEISKLCILASKKFNCKQKSFSQPLSPLRNFSFLGSFQPLSQAFQNEINQIYNLKAQE
ncbi:MAG: HD domain-containing protein [Candidatus Rickettsia vulgarisii]